MKATLIVLLIGSFSFLGLNVDNSSIVAKKKVAPITFSELQEKLSNTGDELLVCNFWATWCKPCIEEEVVLLDEPNLSQDDWIPLIDKNWEGDIPATLYINTSKDLREFYTGSYEDFEELETKVKALLK